MKSYSENKLSDIYTPRMPQYLSNISKKKWEGQGLQNWPICYLYCLLMISLYHIHAMSGISQDAPMLPSTHLLYRPYIPTPPISEVRAGIHVLFKTTLLYPKKVPEHSNTLLTFAVVFLQSTPSNSSTVNEIL